MTQVTGQPTHVFYKLWVRDQKGLAWQPSGNSYKTIQGLHKVVKYLDQAAGLGVELKHPWQGCEVFVEVTTWYNTDGKHGSKSEILTRKGHNKYVPCDVTYDDIMAAYCKGNKTNSRLGLLIDSKGEYRLVSPKLQSTEALEDLVFEICNNDKAFESPKADIPLLTPEVLYYEIDLVTGEVYQDDRSGGLEQVPPMYYPEVTQD